MPRMPLHPAVGTGKINPFAKKVIRFVRYGCTNRPFYHIVVMEAYKGQRQPPTEQLGSYDSRVNVHNERLVAFNFERIRYWLGRGAQPTKSVAELLGLAGFFPIHPRSYMTAWRHRRLNDKQAAQAKDAEEESKEASQTS
ncbi:probable 28S ribosomal protein S16, mitochondrial [Cephus cinctus]|uniref:Small ribosomal subunit protein bS16m n=1 Tax=Cephus cinctus TaxID=211228 RepID=A0AAJ7FV61_CEPCN|nr:probable 28S ribosomal protein S16, mitochondrial [Cephus cinctus]